MSRRPPPGEACPDPGATSSFSRRGLFGGAALLGGALVTGASGLALPGRAWAADVAEPAIHDRAAWGARPPSEPVLILDQGPDHVVVHHTASANSTDYSQEHAYQLSRDIQNHHMDGNGWIDAGQQLTISRGGFVMEGRDQSVAAIRERRHVQGANVGNENSHIVGIENEGLYTEEAPPGALLDSLVATMAWLCDTYQLDPYEAIVGHRDYNPTECPGQVLYDMLPELRERTAAAMGQRAKPRLPVRRPHRRGSNPPSRGRFDHGPAVG